MNFSAEKGGAISLGVPEKNVDRGSQSRRIQEIRLLKCAPQSAPSMIHRGGGRSCPFLGKSAGPGASQIFPLCKGL